MNNKLLYRRTPEVDKLRPRVPMWPDELLNVACRTVTITFSIAKIRELST